MATTKITSPDLFDLGSLNTALKLPSGTTAERPTSPSTGEWRYNTDNNLIEFWDGGSWRELQDEDLPLVPSENFSAVLYDGTSATHAITGLGFQPDLVWIKDRNNAEQHILNDSTRGAGNDLSSNTTAAEANRPTGFLSFDSDGFTLGTDGGGVVNDSTRGPYVAWCWKANGGTTSSNNDGTITSTVQASNASGFSIVKYDGSLVSGSTTTIGHGLSAAPELIILKVYEPGLTASTWFVYSSAVGSSYEGALNTTGAFGVDTNRWNNTAPTSTVFSVGSSFSSYPAYYAGDTIAYCFHSVAGYSKIGSYTGTGSTTNRPIINTGFEPAFVMIKNASATGSWMIHDNKRNTSNPRDKYLRAESSNAEGTFAEFGLDFLSNGFQIGPTTNYNWNASGNTYIYMAFAADPSAAPVLADSFDILPYTGTGNDQTISGYDFNIANGSFLWVKSRNASNNHNQYDTIRGPLNRIVSNSTQAEDNLGGLNGFTSDGFTLRGGYDISQAYNYITYAWKTTIPTINTDGTIQTVVSANANAGFSIMKWTGPLNSNNGDTFGHGLNQAPEFVIMKQRNIVNSWWVWHKDLSAGNIIQLNSTDAENTTLPGVTATSTTITTAWTSNTYDWIVYCWHSVSGYSKIGSYTGNGSSTGPVVTTGFQPDWIMIKRTDTGGYGWYIFDSVRSPSNPRTLFIAANAQSTEGNIANSVDFNSNDFQLKNTDPAWNQSGGNYIYMAFKIN